MTCAHPRVRVIDTRPVRKFYGARLRRRLECRTCKARMNEYVVSEYAFKRLLADSFDLRKLRSILQVIE